MTFFFVCIYLINKRLCTPTWSPWSQVKTDNKKCTCPTDKCCLSILCINLISAFLKQQYRFWFILKAESFNHCLSTKLCTFRFVAQKTHYDILGVTMTASQAEIKKAFIQKSKKVTIKIVFEDGRRMTAEILNLNFNIRKGNGFSFWILLYNCMPELIYLMSNWILFFHLLVYLRFSLKYILLKLILMVVKVTSCENLKVWVNWKSCLKYFLYTIWLS